MPYDSPAKQDRYQRHLMRQRGAGARAINAIFGFNFAFGASSANDARPTCEDLPKRTKPVDESARQADCALDTVKNIQTETHTDVKSVKPAKKARRKLPIDDSPLHASVPERDGDDSFMATARIMKPPTNRKLGDSLVIHVVTSGAKVEGAVTLAKGRPKRRAATHAAAKIAKGIAEEVAPPGQRYDLELPRKPTRRRVKADLEEQFADDMASTGSKLEHAYASERRVEQPALKKEDEASSRKIASTKRKCGSRKRIGIKRDVGPDRGAV